jgi:hypothetical protein
MECRFCRQEARWAVPYIPEQSPTSPIWVPVCEEHYANWYAGIDLEDRLPAFPIEPAVHKLFRDKYLNRTTAS